MQDKKLIKLLNDYIKSFDLAKIKVIPLIKEDNSRILEVDDETIEKIFNGNTKKINDFKYIRYLKKAYYELNLEFEITPEQNNLIDEFISSAEQYILAKQQTNENENIEYAKKTLKLLTSDSLTLDIYTDIDMEVIYHIMAYQILTPKETNEILNEILSIIKNFQEELPNIEYGKENEDYPKRELTNEEATIISDYASQFSHIAALKEAENIELYNALQNSQNIMEQTSIRQKLVEGNLRLALDIFIDEFLKYYPKRDLNEILGELGLIVVEAINKYNPEERTLEKLLKSEIRAFVKNETKKLDTPLSMEESAQQMGIIIREEDLNLDNEYLREIYNAMDVEPIQEDSALEATDTELSVLDALGIGFYLSKLEPIQARIMKLRLGIDSLPMTQKQIAETIGVTQSYVSQQEKEARTKLKEFLEQTRSFRK